MSGTRQIGRVLLTGLGIILITVLPVFPATVGEIAQELACTCGCNMVVSACEGTMECSAAANIRDQIVAKLDAGQSKEEILAFFVTQYGEKILSSPTKRGFNLTAWVLPFAVVISATGMIYALLKTWASRKKPDHEPLALSPDDEVYLERMEKELKAFDS